MIDAAAIVESVSSLPEEECEHEPERVLTEEAVLC
jgi:hypothetical protein